MRQNEVRGESSRPSPSRSGAEPWNFRACCVQTETQFRCVIASETKQSSREAGNSGEESKNCDALMATASSGFVDFVRVVLGYHPDVNWRDRTGATALMRSRNPKVIEALLAAGADPWLVDKAGRNAFDIVSQGGAGKDGAAVLQRWMAEHPKPF